MIEQKPKHIFTTETASQAGKKGKNKSKHPNHVEKIKFAMKNRWKDKEYRAKKEAYSPTEDTKRKASETLMSLNPNRQLFAYAEENDLIPKILDTGMVTEGEIRRIRISLQTRRGGIHSEVFERLSIAIAKYA